MKKLGLFLWMGCLSLAFISCDKDDVKVQDFQAGEIPGLGEAVGELTGAPFNLPDGVELTGEITGRADQYNYWNCWGDYATQTIYQFVNKDGTTVTRTLVPPTRTDLPTHYLGSGMGYVDLLIPMHNSKSHAVTVTFPAALIVKNIAGDCQNGVLIKEVKVEIPAQSDYKLCLSFYCGNLHRGTAGYYDEYVLGVVSDAKPLQDLCEMVKNKRINIEEFDSTNSEEYYIYRDQTGNLQSIVWEITDYDGLDEDDIEYLQSLPNSL